MKKIILSIIGLSIIGLAHAGESVANPKTTATMQATCSINVSPIGWGVVATPLMNQSAQSEMSVKCSNASAYTIDLAYGGIYGAGSSNSGYNMAYAGNVGAYNQYQITNSSGANVGHLICGHTTYTGQISFTTLAVAQLYGSTASGSWISNAGINACVSNGIPNETYGTANGTYPKGWVGSYDASGKQPVGGPGYAYGVMNGSFKGDKLAYSIAVPGEPTKVWNSGNSSYKSTGNGDFQIIPVVAKIIPGKSGSQYPAQDMYLDTITAVISY